MFRRHLRIRITPAEKLFRKALQKRGIRTEKQYPIRAGNRLYTVDLVALPRAIIELKGSCHSIPMRSYKDEIFSKDALAAPHRTVMDPKARKIEVLNEALKHEILKELRKA